MTTFSNACRRTTERLIVNMTVDVLLAAGHTLAVDNGDDRHQVPYTRDPRALKAGLMLCDEEALLVRGTNSEPSSFVKFVYGNDGWDVISDYGISLEEALKPVNDFADAIESGNVGVFAAKLVAAEGLCQHGNVPPDADCGCGT